MATPDSVATFRRQFPIFREQVYLNSCSKGALAEPVRTAIGEFVDTWAQRGSAWDVWGATLENARAAFARLIHAEPDEVAVTFSASTAINSVLSCLDYSARPSIVTSGFEFPTVRNICLAQEAAGATVRSGLSTENEQTLEDYTAAFDERTQLVAATQVCYFNGFTNRWVRSLADATHAHGAWLMLDAYQGLGAEPVDVRQTGVDFLVSGAHKYLLGVQGTAFLYIRRELLQQVRPRDTGWMGQRDPFGPIGLDYASDARRFETGTPAHLSVYAALAGMRLLEAVGSDVVAAWIGRLAQRLIDGCLALGLDVLTSSDPSKRGPLVAVKAIAAEQLVLALRDERLITSHRHGALRVSLHYYNTEDDVDHVLDALRRHRHLVASC